MERYINIIGVICIVVAVLTLVEHRPLELFQCKLKDNTFVPSRKCPHLFVCTHDYEHIDLLSVSRVVKKWSKSTGRETKMLVADRLHNQLFNMFMNPDADVMYVRKGTVSKATNELKFCNLCMFLYRNSTATGLYYIRKLFCGPLIFVQIKSATALPCTGHEVTQCIQNTFSEQFEMTYKMIDNDPINADVKTYVEFIQNELYGRTKTKNTQKSTSQLFPFFG